MSEEKQVSPQVQAFLERVRSRRPNLQKVELQCLGTVYLRRPSGADQLKVATLREELTAEKIVRMPPSIFAASMGAVLLLQEDGNPFFEDLHTGFRELVAMDAQDLKELYDKIMEHCAPQLTEKALESAEKKSSSDQISPSGTNSHS